MNLLGEKIQSLRKNKNITQTELANAISVSPQSVSKWENDLTVPDISHLPVIARYFGITIDELFGYKLDSLNYKERFIRFMAANGMLRFGNFELLAGRISPYYIHSGYYKNAAQISRLGEFFAACIREDSISASLIIGNTKRQIPVVIATCISLYEKYGFDANYCVDYELTDSLQNSKMIMIADTFTTGATLKELLAQIKEKFDVYPSDIIVSVDRMETNGDKKLSVRSEIEQEYGLKIHSIVTVDDIIAALEKGVVGRAEYTEALKKYRIQYVSER